MDEPIDAREPTVTTVVDVDEPTVGWEPLEVLAASVLGAVTVFVVAGLVGGIVGAAGTVQYESGRQFVGLVMEFATGWGIVADAFLVGALVILWWLAGDSTARVGGSASDGPATDGIRRRRFRRFGTWTAVLLVAAVAATTASFVANALTGGAPHDSTAWERYIIEVGTVIVSLLIAVGGLWVVRYLTNLSWAGEDEPEDDERADEPEREYR
jgi:hypothetical protein